jgi:hypothetical protein
MVSAEGSNGTRMTRMEGRIEEDRTEIEPYFFSDPS